MTRVGLRRAGDFGHGSRDRIRTDDETTPKLGLKLQTWRKDAIPDGTAGQ